MPDAGGAERIDREDRGRATWGSKLAFLLAAAGGSVGLGNVWGFPTLAGQNGGAAFLAVYLLAVATIGTPVMLAELAIGRRARRNPIGAFRRIAPGTAWVAFGILAVFSMIVIIGFYSVVAGWTLVYVGRAASGGLGGGDAAAAFAGLAADPARAIGSTFAFLGLTVAIVAGGVRRGIERWSKILMPILFVLLALLTARAVTLEGAGGGLAFYLQVGLGELTPAAVLAAVGQAFFSLSLGTGAMITYGSYVSAEDDLPSSTAWIVGLDTGVAFLAGLLVFPTLFHAGLPPDVEGPGMVFVAIASLLGSIPPEPWGGLVFGTSFFLLLAVAAVTSGIAMLEIPVSWLIDERGAPRRKAAVGIGAVAFALGIPIALSGGAVETLSRLPGLGIDLLSLLFTVFGQYALVVGALGVSLFVGWSRKGREAAREIAGASARFALEGPWRLLIRFVCPVAIGGILVSLVAASIAG